MAKYGNDPIDGRPQFRDTDAPDIKLDPQQAADYAAEVGNRIVGTTAYLDGYPFKRDGLAGYDTTRGSDVICRGGVWRRVVSYREFTLSRATMSDNATFFQAMAEETSLDTEPAFAFTYTNTGGNHGLLTPQAGVYMVSVTAHPGGAATGPTFVQIRAAAQGVIGRGGVALNADPTMTCSSLFHTDGAEGFWVDIQKQTGGSSNGSGRLRIARIGDI